MTLSWPLDSRQLFKLGIASVVMYLAARMVWWSSGGPWPTSALGYLAMMLLVPLLLRRPRVGLYLLCFSLLLVPFWVNDRFFPVLSVNIFFALFPLAAFARDLLKFRQPIVLSAVTLPLAIAGAVLLVGVSRHGLVEYMRYPQVLIQGLLLFSLGLYFCRTRGQVLTLVLVLAAAFTLRNTIEIFENLMAVKAGEGYSTIRTEQFGGFFQTASTGHSAFRGFMLPVFIAMFMYVKEPSNKLLLAVAIISSAAWIGIAGSRIGLISIVVGLLFLVWRMPGKWVAISIWLGLLAVTALAAALMFPVMLQVTLQHFENLLTGNEHRVVAWGLAFKAFIANPFIGTEVGPNHSYFLGRAREVGLLFLIPYCIALWRVWCHTSWMRRHETDPIASALAIGMQAALLTAIFQNFVGTGWQVGEYSLVFWLLVGANEALYVRARRDYSTAGTAASPATVPVDDRRRLEPTPVDLPAIDWRCTLPATTNGQSSWRGLSTETPPMETLDPAGGAYAENPIGIEGPEQSGPLPPGRGGGPTGRGGL